MAHHEHFPCRAPLRSTHPLHVKPRCPSEVHCYKNASSFFSPIILFTITENLCSAFLESSRLFSVSSPTAKKITKPFFCPAIVTSSSSPVAATTATNTTAPFNSPLPTTTYPPPVRSFQQPRNTSAPFVYGSVDKNKIPEFFHDKQKFFCKMAVRAQVRRSGDMNGCGDMSLTE